MSTFTALRNALVVALLGLSAVSLVEFATAREELSATSAEQLAPTREVLSTTPAEQLAITREEPAITIPTGTILSVRLSGVGPNASRVKDSVTGELAGAVVVAGRVVLPEGSPVSGIVTQSGGPKAITRKHARIDVRFTSLALLNPARSYRIETRSSPNEARLKPGSVLRVRLTRPLIVRAA